MSIIRNLKNKKAVEIAGVEFKVREDGFQFGTIGVFRLSICECFGEVDIRIYMESRTRGCQSIATNRQIVRFARKANLCYWNNGTSLKIVLHSLKDERRFAAFIPALTGKRMQKTLIACGYHYGNKEVK